MRTLPNVAHRARILALGAACLALAAGRTLAADGSTTATAAAPATPASLFTVKLDPAILEGLWNDTTGDDAKFEEYRDLSDGFRIPFLHLTGESADRNRTLDLTVVNGGRTDARYTLEYGLGGSWNLLLDYNKIPHRLGDNGHSLYTQTSPGVFEIADPEQRYVETSILAQGAAATGSILAPLFATADSVDLALERDRTTARLELGKGGNLSWGLEYDHEKRTGSEAGGASFGFSLANEIATPINYDTDDAKIGGEWKGRMGNLAFGYTYSKFKNNVSTMVWDNPLKAPTSPSARGFADLPADNSAATAYLNGGLRFGRTWWANGNVNYIQMRQDAQLLAYTINPGVVGTNFDGSKFDASNASNLPQQHAGQAADVLNIGANLGTKFGDGFRLLFRYRYYDYANNSDRIEFPGYVSFNGPTFTVEERVTAPYAYRNDDLGAELAWDVASASILTLSYDHKNLNRKFREVADSNDDVIKLSFDSRLLDGLTVRAAYEYIDSSISGYRTTAEFDTFGEPLAPGNLPQLRMFSQAARKTNSVQVQLDWQTSAATSLEVTLKGGKDDYDQSSYGLLYAKFATASAEFDWNPSDNNAFYAYGTYGTRHSSQKSRQSGAVLSTNPIDDWSLKANEKNDDLGLGWTSTLAKQWTLDLSGQWTRADGTGDFAATPGGLPLSGTPVRTAALDLSGNYDSYDLYSLHFKLDYAINDRLGVGLWYLYEDYTEDTYRLQGINGNFLPGNTIALDPIAGDYRGNVVGLNLKFAM